MTLQANEWIYTIKHHHFPRDVSAKENESRYDTESPGSDLNETLISGLPNTQVVYILM